MKQIFLLRHAKSSWDDPSLEDIERPLNKRGRRAAKAMADHLKKKNIAPQVVLCSTSVRTRQTLDLLLPVLGDAEILYDDRIYDAAPQTLLARLKELPAECGCVLIIGHNPGLERLALGLADGKGSTKALAKLAEKYPTGSLAGLSCASEDWESMEAAGCRLESFICPSDLGE